LANQNTSQVFIKPSNYQFEDRKLERDLTPKQKKIFEQNPKMSFNEIKQIRSKAEEKNEINNPIEFSLSTSSKNNTLFNKVSFNHSNIFNDSVIF
jgi:hypothetical protein